MKISSTSNGVFQNNNMHYHLKKLRWKAKDSRIAKGILEKKKKKLKTGFPVTWTLESERSPGEGNGNPLEYSCLENPMERGAW